MYGGNQRNTGLNSTRAPRTPQNRGAGPSRLPSTTGRPSDMRRMSWAPSSANRLSGFTGRPSVSTLAVTKPDVKRKNKEKVIKFLCDFGYEQAYIERSISTKNGYKTLFEFIVGRIFENEEFTIGDKLEMDIPEIMRYFEYPFPIKAAYFQPVGVIHTFPHLLAILAFLVDIFETYEHMSKNPPSALNFNDSQDSTTHAYNYAFILTTFKKCREQLEGNPTEEFLIKERDAYMEAFDTQEELATEASEWEFRANEVKCAQETLEKEKSAVQETDRRLQERTEGARKCREFLKMKHFENDKKSEELKSLEDEESQLRTEHQLLTTELEDVTRRLREQTMSGEEAREIKRECEILADVIASMSNEIQKLKSTNDESLRRAMKQGSAIREQFGHLVSTLENLWRSSATHDEQQSFNFEGLRYINPVQVTSALGEGGCIQELCEKILERIRNSDQLLTDAQSMIKSQQSVLEGKISEIGVAIHKAEAEQKRIVEHRKREELHHENEVHQLKLNVEVKLGEKQLYDKERPDVIEMREKLFQEQKRLIAMQQENENEWAERSQEIFMTSDQILRGMEHIEGCQKMIEDFEDDVVSSLKKVLSVMNKTVRAAAMKSTSAILLCLLFLSTVSDASRPLRLPKLGVLPKGEPIPQECCRTFCYPIEVCICCFENYEYFDGTEMKAVKGVPDWLKKKMAPSQ
ncbi:hypothetical protein QR680_013107 [Steinernema hermaphroditum]|uniref:Kinetochore protein NDC80 n=1 Tax=Steinernema hermaphroditum TaxID=289476 RepID=A0AA39I6Z7_9BILA|nr:hypothetical protein QR680_013107 [Steinernema hermaphroditum]